MRPPVVIVGLASPVGLQAARIFAARGIEVIGLANDMDHYAVRTRVCHRILRADVHSPAIVDVLERLGYELAERAVVLPCTDQAALTLAKSADRLASWYDLALPSYAILETLADKGRFADLATALGLPIPRTWLLRSRGDAEAAERELSFPVVVKPHVKSSVWWERANVKVLTVDTPSELATAYERLHPWTAELVAQEFIPGHDSDLFTCNCYYASDGELLIMFTTRKQRQWPRGTGIASYATECRNDELVGLARQLFESVGFAGLGYLEAKLDRRTGRLVLIEANVGRPTGRAGTAEAGGVPLLWTMYCDAAGLAVPSADERRQHQRGAAWVDLRRDGLACWTAWRLGELTLHQWWKDWTRPRMAHAVFSWSDPRPFATEIIQSLSRTVRRRLATGR